MCNLDTGIVQCVGLRILHHLIDRRMMSIDHTHQRLATVGQQVPAIGNLYRIGRSSGDCLGIHT